MEINLERKYIFIIVILAVLLLFGIVFLAAKNGFLGKGTANLSRAGRGWIEIKPRVGNSTSSGEVFADESEIAAKNKKPVVQWCVPGIANAAPPKDIIINEIAWMGTANSYSDEWLELKNIAREPVDLAGWQLQNKSQKIKIAFAAGEILAPGGLYLLERTDDETAPGATADKIYKGSLANANEALYLFDADCRLRDSIVAAKWPAGDNIAKKTMVRLPDLSWKTGIAGGSPKAENR